ncbi:MAG: leucine-rich repeat domain-containing protein [Rikenellaceae bacterium]
MKLTKKLLFALACTLFSSIAFAHDFSTVTNDGKIFFFNVTNAKNLQVEVTYEGSITSPVASQYIGELTIPRTVRHNGKVYTVTGIGSKAFYNATRLTGVTLPSEISTIGNFAFEKCVNLQRVVFSGSISTLGEGIFFGCTSISHVSLGSDWVAVNLKMFMWSERLEEINIPAKIAKLQNLKSLKSLKRINVDANNAYYTSIRGVLYNKDNSLLLGCPRAYSGALRVAEGCRSIYYGALIDCADVNSVELPVSLQKLSYQEFSRMKELDYVVVNNPTPIATATIGNKSVFALQVTSRAPFKLVVPRKSMSQYKKSITSMGGEYTAIADISSNVTNLPKVAKKGELVEKDQIVNSVPTVKRR